MAFSPIPGDFSPKEPLRSLLQAVLTDFQFQHGCKDRAVSRHDLEGLFQRDAAIATA